MTDEEKQVPLWKSSTLIHEDMSYELGKKIKKDAKSKSESLKNSICHNRYKRTLLKEGGTVFLIPGSR